MTNVFEKAKILSNHFHGESLSTTSYSICKGKNALKFKCNNQHTFFVGVDVVENVVVVSKNGKNIVNEAATCVQDSWCYKCKKFYELCKEVAA